MALFTKSFHGRKCTECVHYVESYASYEEGGYLEELGCEKPGNERFGNLKSFPFKNRRSCFQIEFWHSRFGELVTGNEGRNERVRKLFEQSDADGNLSPELEAEFQKLWQTRATS